MGEVILNTNTLPPLIREMFRTSKVSAQNRDGGVILMPLTDICGLRGIAKGSEFTTEKLFEYRQKEKEFEDRGFEK